MFPFNVYVYMLVCLVEYVLEGRIMNFVWFLLEMLLVVSIFRFYKLVISAEGYIPQKVFNYDKTGLFWKMPICDNRTYMTGEEKRMPGHKPMNNRLTLALCASANPYYKSKTLLVYHSEKKPRDFKPHKILKEKLPAIRRANPCLRAWVRRQFFVE